MPNEPLSTQNYVQIGDKVLNRTADASITTNDVSLSDRIFVFKKNEDGSIKTVVNTTIQYIVDAFSADATAIKASCNQIKADTSQLKADTEALKNAAVTAKTSAESARDSAISAKNSASTSATNASNSASSASASATTATTKASEASASASSASKSATSASTSASNASSSASSASASATSASSSASTATAKASEASTRANQAKGYRDEAKAFRDEINPSLLATKKEVQNAVAEVMKTLYPVGSIYLSLVKQNPGTWIAGTRWSLLDSGYALWTTTASDAGAKIPAGLPNITGEIFVDSGCGIVKYNSYGTGAFNSLGSSRGYVVRTESGSSRSISFDASQSNSIYGKNNTVQPPAMKIYAYRRETDS